MFLRGVILGSLTAVLVLGASSALAGTGVGGIFNLGQSNTVNGNSSLSGSSFGSQLSVSNSATNSTARGLYVNGSSSAAALLAHNSAGPAAAFQSPSSVAPFTVSTTHRVPSLNADLLDGIDSSGFVQGNGKAYTLTVSIPRLNNGDANLYTPSPAVAPGLANIAYFCPPLLDPQDTTTLFDLDNSSGGTLNVFVKNNPHPSVLYREVPDSVFQFTTAAVDLTTLTVQGVPSSTGLQTDMTAMISTAVRTNDCHFQIQAVTTHP